MKLAIIGNKWDVIFKAKVLDPESGIEVAGYCDFIKKQLCVSTNYEHFSKKDADYQITNTLVHEVLHAAFYEADIRDQSWFTYDIEHMIISIVSRVISDGLPVIHRNLKKDGYLK